MGAEERKGKEKGFLEAQRDGIFWVQVTRALTLPGLVLFWVSESGVEIASHELFLTAIVVFADNSN